MENQKKLVKEERGITAITIIIIAVVVMLVIIIFANTIGKKKPLETGTKPEETSEGTKEEYVHVMEDGSKLNVSEEMQKPKKLNNLEVTNVQLKETGGITTLLADIENKGKDTVQEKVIKVEVLDREGKIITTLTGPIDTVEAGKKIQLNLSVTGDISNAYNFRISE